MFLNRMYWSQISQHHHLFLSVSNTFQVVRASKEKQNK